MKGQGNRHVDLVVEGDSDLQYYCSAVGQKVYVYILGFEEDLSE